MSTGNWISVIGFSVCFLYLIVICVFAIVKKIKANKEIKKAEEQKKGNRNESSKVTE
jgi:cytochrome bd-type quinol oxidase subunit 1